MNACGSPWRRGTSTECNNGDAFSPDALAKGAPLHVVTAEPGCGTWRTHAVVPASKLRTLQRGTEPASVLPGANAHEPYLEELAQMSVNVQTAWRMLTDFATLTPTQATVCAQRADLSGGTRGDTAV